MNRTELETLIRLADPAAGDTADQAIRERVMNQIRDTTMRRRPSGPLVATVTFAVLLAAVLIPGLLFLQAPPTEFASSIQGATMVVKTGSIPGVRGMALDGDRVWVMSARDEILYEIPLDGSEVREHDIGFYAEGVVVDGGTVWLGGYDPDQLIRLVPDAGFFGRDELTRIPLPGPIRGGTKVGHERWVSAGEDLVRIGSDGTVIDTLSGLGTAELATGFGSVWGAGPGGSLLKLDPATAEVVERFDLGFDATRITAAHDSLWVVDRASHSVVSILPTTGQIIRKVDVGGAPHGIVAVGDRLWVFVFDVGTLVEIDPATGIVLRTVAMSGGPGGGIEIDGKLGVSLHRAAEFVVLDISQPLLTLPSGPINDQLIELDSGRAVRVRCLGTGSPTVVLEADTGEGVNSWSTVQAMLGTRQRVCSSERSGIWGAEGYPPAASSEEAAADLRSALEAAGESGPYLLVGHGVGGFVARTFAAAHPGDVAGMVLVDTQPDDFLERFIELAPEDMVRGAMAGFLEGNENTRLRTTIGNPGQVPTVILARDNEPELWSWLDRRTAVALEEAWQRGLLDMADLLGARVVHAGGGHGLLLYDAPDLVVDQVEAMAG